MKQTYKSYIMSHLSHVYMKTKVYTEISFMTSISNCLFEKKRNFYQKDKKKVKFILILCDGSTNSSVVDQEVVYTKYTDAETFKPYL